MAVLIGQSINGRDVEQETSSWSPERFASMCDDLAWAESGRSCPTLPSFTSRVNAKDGGIDAEWSVEILSNGSAIPTPIIGPGWNVFQYKKRDLIAQDRHRVISTLKSSLTGAVKDIVERTKKCPDHYVLFVNVDLRSSDKAALKKAILSDSPSQNPHVEIIGAGELKTLLNNQPHLRAAYFAEHSFKTWETAYKDHREQKRFAPSIEFIGREEDLGRLKALVDDPYVRAIVLSGPHDVGKSRLVLEATRQRPHDTVLALDPRSMDLRDYRSLYPNRGEIICIVEDPEPDSIADLLNEVLVAPHFKIIVTLPIAANVPVPSYGRDERVQSLLLNPLASEDARKLLNTTAQLLDFEIENWILRYAGGIPGVLLAAASIGNGIRTEFTNFAEAIGREFEQRIEKELGPEVLTGARLLSVLTHVGIAGDAENELRRICELFGEVATPNSVLLSLTKLERAGLAKHGGSFAEITLPLLANHLVIQVLRGRRHEMFALLSRLEEPGRLRFLRRLSEIQSEEAVQFWDAMFAADGPFHDWQTALTNLRLLRVIAGTVPEPVLRLLEQGLLDSTREERLAIAGERRRELMWTLEELLFRRKTSRGAARLVWLLAEAENETYGNSATEIVSTCFHPWHPQMPLTLRQRRTLLQEFLSEGISKDRKLIAVKIIEQSLTPIEGLILLCSGSGPEPFEGRPPFTYQEFRDYYSFLVDTLFVFAKEEAETSAAALQALPAAIEEFGRLADPPAALRHFRTLVDWARTGTVHLDVASLSGALRRLRDRLSVFLEEDDFPLSRQDEFTNYLVQADLLKAELETANFATCLKRWAGSWVIEDEQELASVSTPRFAEQLKKLAEEAVKNPNILNTKILEWLLSSAAERAAQFFFFLGKHDRGTVFLGLVEELGQRGNGAHLFSAYWRGWAEADYGSASRRLDQLATMNIVTGEAIVFATTCLDVSPQAVERVKARIQAKSIPPTSVRAALLVSQWMKQLTEEQFGQLLKHIIGETFEHVSVVIELLRSWVQNERPLQADLASFAWICLEHDPPVKPPAQVWDFDVVAAKLTESDLTHGFKLLTQLLQRRERIGGVDSDYWQPLSRHGTNRFWNILYAKDRERLFCLLFEVSKANALQQFHLSWRVRELINQEEDKNLLLSLANPSAENARILTSWITSAKPGFWPIVFALVPMYPHDEQMLSNFTSGLEQEGFIRRGPRSRFYEGRKQEILQILSDPTAPAEVCTWLREILSRLEREIPRQLVWEYDMDVDDLRHHVQDKDSPQRIWAIGRILKYTELKDINRLLTVDDITEALPLVDLPDKRRRMFERAVKVWQHGQ